jgi:hypothetical protein
MIKPPSQAPFAPVPQAWFSFSLFAFIFQLFSCPSPLFIPHNSSFIIYHLSLSFQLALKHFMRYA